MNSEQVAKFKLKDLLLETRDGEWGKDSPQAPNDVKMIVIRGTDFIKLRNGAPIDIPIRYISKRLAERKQLKIGDILLETAGGSKGSPTGRTCFIESETINDLPLICASFSRYLRVNPKIVSPRYIYWYLQFLYQNGVMEKFQVQHTGIARFQYTVFSSSIDIPVPDKPIQNKITQILDSLEKKIQINNVICKNLEVLAQTLFKRWFVDFEFPNENGEPYKSSGGKFEECELGMIPKGWRIDSLDGIATYLNGLAMQKYRPEGEDFIPVIKIKELNLGRTNNNSDRACPYINEKYIINDGDVLFSWSGTLEVKLWCGGVGALNQHLYKVSSSSYNKWFYYYWTHYYIEKFRRIAKDKATTMGHIKRSDLKEAKVLVPVARVYQSANLLFTPIVDKIIRLNIESNKLGLVKDTLLPKLMSGEIRVPTEQC